ncbi:MAG: hypothetical protein QXL94_04430 [Candidatus Parvarchaeum sp.]
MNEKTFLAKVKMDGEYAKGYWILLGKDSRIRADGYTFHEEYVELFFNGAYVGTVNWLDIRDVVVYYETRNL